MGHGLSMPLWIDEGQLTVWEEGTVGKAKKYGEDTRSVSHRLPPLKSKGCFWEKHPVRGVGGVRQGGLGVVAGGQEGHPGCTLQYLFPQVSGLPVPGGDPEERQEKGCVQEHLCVGCQGSWGNRMRCQ